MKATLTTQHTDENLRDRFKKVEDSSRYSEMRRLQGQLRAMRQQLRHQEDMISNLRQQAMQDTLTGVGNRRAFEHELELAHSYFRRYGHNGAVMMLDINDFKAINDNLGHLAGDALLKHIASLLHTHIRETDVVCRVGGDEFAIILREVSAQQVMDKAQRLMYTIANSPCRHLGHDVYVTASIGWCTFSDGPTSADLIKRADEHMYKVKETMIPV